MHRYFAAYRDAKAAQNIAERYSFLLMGNEVTMAVKIDEFEKKIGYNYKDINLLKLALTHSSYGNEVYKDRHRNNERLEFLGDAVLELTVSDYLFHNYPNEPEGKLTKKRASIVCEPTLASCAKKINLPDVLYLGKGEEITGGRFRDSIISDAFEAVIGSIYLDGGIECAKTFINRFVLDDIDNMTLFVDSKTILQERIQAGYKEGPSYHLVAESGPDHCKVFEVNVCVGKKVIGTGCGRTKKAAEQQAAYNAIINMKSRV